MAVVTGAFVSFMRAGHGDEPQHCLSVLWTCSGKCGIANAEGHHPIDNLEKELGWPVTREVLAFRYDGCCSAVAVLAWSTSRQVYIAF